LLALPFGGRKIKGAKKCFIHILIETLAEIKKIVKQIYFKVEYFERFKILGI
jgi:hypothetical protein